MGKYYNFEINGTIVDAAINSFVFVAILEMM